MKKLILLSLVLVTLFAGCQKKEDEASLFAELEEITFEQLDQKLENKETMIVYFGWVDQCEDSQNIQNNYFQEALKNHPEWKEQILVVNLDNELPEGLKDHDARAPMAESYNVSYSPTIIYYENGEIISKIEWTPLTSDPTTAIPKDLIDQFFTEIGLLP